MLGKLLKYDFRSQLKSLVPLWIAFIAVSILNRLSVTFLAGSFNSHYDFSSFPFVEIIVSLVMLLYIGLMVAINVIGIVLVIQRFYNGLLRDEGYLVFTLPVEPWELVTSKGISASVLILVNGLVSLVSILIMSLNADAIQFITRLPEWLSRLEVNVFLVGLLLILLIIATVAKSIYQIYAAMTIGHLSQKRRVASSVAAYIGISFGLSFLGSMILAILSQTSFVTWLENVLSGLESINSVSIISLLVLLLLTIIQLAAFHIVTERILAKKLNLE